MKRRDPMNIAYVYPFANRCSVTIPGSLHGYQTKKLDVFFDETCPGPTLPIRPEYVDIHPVSRDVTVVFAVPHTGVIVVVPQES
jgi:hypothetical protein